MLPQHLSHQNSLDFDPLRGFLQKQLHLNQINLCIIFLVYTLILYGYLTLIKEGVSFYNIFALLFRCIVFSLIPVLYLWSGQSIFRLLRALAKEKTLVISKRDWHFIQTAHTNSKLWCLRGCVASTILHTLVFAILLLLDPIQRWEGVSIFIKLPAIAFNFPFSYMMYSLSAKLILNTKILYRFLSRHPLKVQPFHPDRCGGFRPLQQYTLHSTYGIASIGGIVGLAEYLLITDRISKLVSSAPSPLIAAVFPERPDIIWLLHFFTFVYIVLSLTVFLGPMLAVHKEMLDAKETLLKDISEQFQADYNNLKTLLRDNSEALKEQVDKFEQLETLYSRASKFPVWPFDIQTLRKYCLSAAAPILPAISTFSKNLFDNLLSTLIT